MRQRERLSKSIVEKYSTDIYFMVKTDETLMEAVEPRTIWVIELGYEVDDNILDLYAKMLLDAPLDDKTKHFGTTKDKAFEVKTSFNRKRREKKIDKMSAYIQDVTHKIDTQLGSGSKLTVEPTMTSTAEVKKHEAYISTITFDSDPEDNEPLAFRRVQRKKVDQPSVEKKKVDPRRRLVR